MAEEKQASLKPLTIYFYHTRLTRESYEEWKEYKFPGHILYGLPLLEKHGIHSVMHKCQYFSSRLRLMLYATKRFSSARRNTGPLRHLFPGYRARDLPPCPGAIPQPIVIWHHTAVVNSSGFAREQISRLFYKGIDKMFLFSRKLIQDS